MAFCAFSSSYKLLGHFSHSFYGHSFADYILCNSEKTNMSNKKFSGCLEFLQRLILDVLRWKIMSRLTVF